MVLQKVFNWLDQKSENEAVKRVNQIIPVVVCTVLFVLFMALSHFFIEYLINPFSSEKIQIELHLVDVLVGFFLYFVTAVDYALVVGRMQIANPGAKPRLVMNIYTCVGCFFGVTLVLFLWGFAKEIPLVIIPILIFAGSVMVKLAHEGIEYYEKSQQIPSFIRAITVNLLKILFFFTHIFTFWVPELGSPKVERMKLTTLAKWSFFLPFIIGTDDLVGYMGAMTIYNVFSLLFGIYLADIIIDLIIFISPKFTKRIVENAILSLLAAFAFIYLAYKSYSESILMMQHDLHLPTTAILIICVIILIAGAIFSKLYKEKHHETQLPAKLD